MDISWSEVTERFRQIWHYDDLRSPQGEIIQALLEGKDTLVVLPTGLGKSICFQLPALLQTGLTIVVSPLVALMENQVQQLKNLGLSGALLHSELPRRQRQQTLQQIAHQQLSLLYLSPETLLSLSVWQILAQPQIKINGLIIDEVHCLTQWGVSFRPAYRRLGAVRRSLLHHKPSGTKMAIAAFTATADASSQQSIIKALELEEPIKFLVSPYRSNLRLRFQTVWTPRGRNQRLLQCIKSHAQQAGLIYVRSRQVSETLAKWLGSLGYDAVAYHAGLSSQARRKIEQDWLTNQVQLVVCTSAFGMGIDKPDVRFIVHYHAPELLAEYIQEVGRGGRDGKLATALTLVSEATGWFDPADRQRRKFFSRHWHQQYRHAQKLAQQLPAKGALAQVKSEHSELTLSMLHSLDLVTWPDPFHYHLKSHKIDFQPLARQHTKNQKLMQQYQTTPRCRWQYLLWAFGFKQEAQGLKCGHCDNCLRGQ